MSQAVPTGMEQYLDAEEREARSKKSQTEAQNQAMGKLIPYILRHRGTLVAGIALILLGTAASLVEPRLFGYAIDEAIVPRKMDALKRLTLFFLLVECIRVSAMIGQAYLFEKLGQGVMQDLRLSVFGHLQALPISVFDKNPVGRLITRVTNDVSALADMFSAGFVMMIGNILIVIGILVWLLVMNLELGLISIAVFPAMIWASAYFSGRLRIAYRNARSRLSALNAFLAENILGMRIVHLFNRQARHLERFKRINDWYAEAQFGTVKVFALFQPTITICSGAAMALALGFGGVMASRGEIKLGVLVAFFAYVMSLFQPVREIADKWNIFLSGMASAERIFSIMDWKPEMPPSSAALEAAPVPGIRGHIVFENVWFAYEGERWVLKDLSFELEPGMKVGVVGHTGAGKTTLISLLLRFHEPQKGRILLDGKDLREYDRRRLRASIGIVQQDVFLFSGSLRDNVFLWRDPSDPRSKELDLVVQQMGIDRFSDRLKSEQALEERGSNLSMGERQILAFARALAADPAIWILDEATANVDSHSEKILSAQLERVASGRTAILIAHRLATVRSADLILVLHRGSLVEQGAHESLVAHGGLYAKLYRYQSALDSVRSEPANAAYHAE